MTRNPALSSGTRNPALQPEPDRPATAREALERIAALNTGIDIPRWDWCLEHAQDIARAALAVLGEETTHEEWRICWTTGSRTNLTDWRSERPVPDPHPRVWLERRAVTVTTGPIERIEIDDEAS